MPGKGFTVVESVIALGLLALLGSLLFMSTYDMRVRVPVMYQKYASLETLKETLLRNMSYVEMGIEAEASVGVYDVGPISKELTASSTFYLFSTDVTDWNRALGASTCNINPVATTSYKIAAGYTFPSNFLPASMDLLNNRLYVAGKGSKKTDPDLYILNIATPTSPVLLGAGSVSPSGVGLAAIRALPNMVVAATRSTRYPLEIINTSVPTSPTSLFQYEISTSSSLTDYGIGNAVHYSDKKLFLGLTKSTTSEFFVFSFDPGAPALPALLGSYETGTEVNAIASRGQTVFLATPNQEQVRILDASNPTNIVEKSSLSPPGYSVQDGKSLFLVGNTLYVGRTVGGFDNPNNHEFFVYDVSNEYAPKLVTSENIASSLNDLAVDHGKSFFLIGAPEGRAGVYDMSSSAPVEITRFPSGTGDGSIDCEDDTIAYLSASDSAVTILTH